MTRTNVTNTKTTTRVGVLPTRGHSLLLDGGDDGDDLVVDIVEYVTPVEGVEHRVFVRTDDTDLSARLTFLADIAIKLRLDETLLSKAYEADDMATVGAHIRAWWDAEQQERLRRTRAVEALRMNGKRLVVPTALAPEVDIGEYDAIEIAIRHGKGVETFSITRDGDAWDDELGWLSTGGCGRGL